MKSSSSSRFDSVCFAIFLLLIYTIRGQCAPIQSNRAATESAIPPKPSLPFPSDPGEQPLLQSPQRALNSAPEDGATPRHGVEERANKQNIPVSEKNLPSDLGSAPQEKDFGNVKPASLSRSESSLDSSGKQDEESKVSRMSMFKAIQPALNAALSKKRNLVETLQPQAKLHDIDFKSTPLHGTEGRDRHALKISTPKEDGKNGSGLEHAAVEGREVSSHGDNRMRHYQGLTISNGNGSVRDGLPSHPQSDGRRMRSHGKSSERRESLGAQRIAKKKTKPYPYNKESHTNPEEHLSRPIETVTPTPRPPSKQKSDDRSGNDLKSGAKAIWEATASFGSVVFKQLKAAMEKLKSKGSSPSPSPNRSLRGDGYTEEDVASVVEDVMREIQMRGDEMQEQVVMRQKTEEETTNPIPHHDRRVAHHEGPLLYMKTKVLVAPETVVDAVMTSARRMLLTRDRPLPWSETSMLLNEVQARLSEVLTPADLPRKRVRPR